MHPSLFPHYCDNLHSCHSSTCIPSGFLSLFPLVMSWWQSSGLPPTFPAQWCTSHPALRLTAGRVEKPTGKGKPLDFCVFMEGGYDPITYLIFYLMASLPALKMWCPLTHTSNESSLWGNLCRGGKGEKETNTNQTWEHAQLQPWNTLPLLSARLPQKLPSLPLPSPHRPITGHTLSWC